MVGVSGWPVLSVLNAAGTLNEPTAFEPTQVGNAVINGVAPVNESDGDRAVREGTVDSDADRAIRNQQDDEYRYAVQWLGWMRIGRKRDSVWEMSSPRPRHPSNTRV